MHQLIKIPTRITCNTLLSLIIFKQATQRERVTLQGIIDEHCLTINSFFIQEKFIGLKETHKQITFSSFKHYWADLFKETLTSINFPNYQNLNDATETYDNLTVV